MYEEEILGAARKESVLGPRGTSEEQLFKQGVLVHRQFGRSYFKKFWKGGVWRDASVIPSMLL